MHEAAVVKVGVGSHASDRVVQEFELGVSDARCGAGCAHFPVVLGDLT